MTAVYSLTMRNIKIFRRDKATVFFSFLSSLIIVALYFLFIANLYTSAMDNAGSGSVAMPLSDQAKNFIVYLQMMAGVFIINSFSTATGVFSTIATDFESKRIDSFLLTPVKTSEIILSYFATGLVVSFSINAFTWLISFLIIGLVTGYWLAAGTFLMVLLVLFIATLVSSSVMLLITSLVKSSAAIGVISGVSGTFIGFLCGIYLPYSNLGEGAKAVGSFLPFSHLTIWLKQVMLDDGLSQLGVTGELKSILYRDHFSAESIGFCTLAAPLWLTVLVSCALGLLCLLLSFGFLNKRIKR